MATSMATLRVLKLWIVVQGAKLVVQTVKSDADTALAVTERTSHHGNLHGNYENAQIMGCNTKCKVIVHGLEALTKYDTTSRVVTAIVKSACWQ